MTTAQLESSHTDQTCPGTPNLEGHKFDKWTAFVTSLAIPGLGQFLVGHWSGLVWLAAAIGVMPVAQLAGLSVWWTGSLLSVLALLSAEHAKRLQDRRAAVSTVITSRTAIEPRRGRAVSIRLEVDVSRPASQLWRQVSDLSSFLTIDPFHHQVVLMRAAPQAGVNLALHHNVFGLRFVRFGRILKWVEGQSYVFSDLSRHDRPCHGDASKGTQRRARRHARRRGFPHVFFIEVTPRGDHGSRLTIRVRGKWTSRWIPLTMARLWLRWVFWEHARLLTKAL